MKYILKGKEIFLENKIINNGRVVINNGVIEQIIEEDISIYEDEIDLSMYKILPGFIDIHVHGGNGYDTMDGKYESINEISKYVSKNGVTGFLPTTVTAKWEKIINAIKAVDDAMKTGVEGAEILGSYIEGPFISKDQKGAHPEEYILPIDIYKAKEIVEAAPAAVKVVAIAPEKENAIELIKMLKSHNIKVSIGHSNASYEETILAIENGADIAIHTFNAMKGLHHREPGTVGAVLSNDKIYSELISDTIHVHPAVMKILVKCKGLDKVCLITDCMMAGGLDDGQYQLGELAVTVKDSIARIDSGSLAGSTLRLIDAIKNMINKVEISPVDAVNMASIVPASILGMDNTVGSIQEGKKANFAIIDDEYNVVMTIVNGKIVYNSFE
ncbi:N-acetylglucosamine-6-phosphate deacetylase [Brassicibacter mesophilus]|uniref:N-acetylglucosamine-6-phosphate deacetylase n=1 Tax=Brassicibacter mesophilus TaxID=745119 RepID=UPI003D1B3D9C